MSKIAMPPRGDFSLSRHHFVQGLAAGGALLGMGMSPRPGRADVLRARMGPAVLSGSRFQLNYNPTAANFTGKDRFATAINGSVPAPVLRWKEGDTVTLDVTNNLAEDISIHWHGIILPSSQDGVPNISDGFDGIRPGETFRYRFPAIQNGTYWYHSHSGFQEQTGAYGAIIVDPKEPEPFAYDRDHVVVLSDWSDEDPHGIYAKLKKLSHYYNFRERTVGEALADIQEKGWSGFWADRTMWNQMRMSDRDISDVTGYTYTFLMNGVTPADGWLGLFERGERVRLRFINAAAMTFFDVRIPGLKMTVVAADGQYVEPVTVDEFRIGVAETYDVIDEPYADQAYTVFAQAIDRSGYAHNILTPDPSLVAEVPAMDPAPVLSHGDMGMAMDHGMHDMGGMDHSRQDMAGKDEDPSARGAMKCGAAMMSGMDHSRHDMGDKAVARKMPMGSGSAGYGSA